MHIRITGLDTPADNAIAALDSLAGLQSAYVLRPMDTPQPLLVTVWDTVTDADRAPITTGGQDYAEVAFEAADSVAERPSYGQLAFFDSRPDAEADAIHRANSERIAPAVRAIPGNVGAFVGRNPDGSFVVLALTTSMQAIEDSQRAIMSTALLPGEDPALLTGPDRIQLAWVLAAISPIPA